MMSVSKIVPTVETQISEADGETLIIRRIVVGSFEFTSNLTHEFELGHVAASEWTWREQFSQKVVRCESWSVEIDTFDGTLDSEQAFHLAELLIEAGKAVSDQLGITAGLAAFLGVVNP